MSEEVVLQSPPEKNFCTDMFDGICVLRGAVEQFFNNREFIRESLADMLPCDEELRVVNAVTSIPENYSIPVIAMGHSDIVFDPISQYTLVPQDSVIVHPTMTVDFEIKTNNYRTTEYMALELSQFLLTFSQWFNQFNIRLTKVVCGTTKLFRDSTPNYFFAKVSVNVGVPLTKWKYQSTDSILRSITYSLNIRGGDMEPITIT